MELKERNLNVGDICTYICSMINGTGATYAKCVVTDVLSKEEKRYRLEEIGGDRSWTLQDIDEKVEWERIGKNLEHLEWIE